MRIVIVSDLHVNSTIGLWPPDFELTEGGVHLLSRFQSTLWRWWLDFNEQVQQYRPYILVLNGDLTQGIRPTKDVAIISSRRDDMEFAALQCLRPLVSGAVRTYVNRGTEWHEGAGGQSAEYLARMFDAVRLESGSSRWETWLKVDEKLFHFTHHTSVASVYPTTPPAREWKRAKELFADGQIPAVPDVMVRSHVHHSGIYPDPTGQRWFFTTPAWQLKGAFIYRINPMSIPGIGGMVLWVEDEEIKWKVIQYNLPQPIIEQVLLSSP